MRHLAILATVLFLLAPGARAQDLSETLSEVGSIYAESYVRPLAETIGTNLNSGLIHAGRWGSGRFNLNLYLGVKAFGTLLDPNAQTFDLTYLGRTDIDARIGSQNVRVNVPAEITVRGAPTVFGVAEPGLATVHVAHDTTVSYLGVLVPVSFDTTFSYETIGGLVETSIAPLAVPQAMIGTLFGTDLMVRWMPRLQMQDVGSVELFGIGIRHSIDQYIPALPFNLAIQVAWQDMRADDSEGNQVVDAALFAANAAISKRFGPLVLYGGYQMEEATVDVTYLFTDAAVGEVDPDPVRINFSVTGRNTRRAIAGLALHAGPLHLTADASFGNYTVLTTGLGIAF